MADPYPEVKGLIGWFAKNHVAANLMMLAIVGGGIYSIFIVQKEMMPEANFNQIQVQVPFRGGAPEEVERGVVVKIEEAIEDLEGVREVTSTASEGAGMVQVEILDEYDLAEMMDEVKLAVDSISTFPAQTERPIISRRYWRNSAVNLQVAGDLDEATMKELAENIRDELLADPEISHVQVQGARPFEISVEVSEETLRQYDLTLEEVSRTIGRWSLDLPGGSIRSDAGDIRLRATGQAYTGQEFADIVLLTRPDGTRLTLGDVATIRDGFSEVEFYSFFNGKRSIGISVMANEDQNPIHVSDAAKRYVEKRKATLPDGVELTAWANSSDFLEDRLDLMVKNMALGAALVLVILGLFLHLKVAAWVLIGLPVAFLGAFMFLPVPFVDVSINMMSLFAFILVLGIVVDDAIIIGESAYTETEEKGYTLPNIVNGARKVAVPATFGVLTTIGVFLPFLFMSGRTASFTAAIGWVVILCLAFSLVESKLILPSHLSIMRSSHGTKKGVADWVDKRLKWFVANVYVPLLRRAISYRLLTLSIFVGLMILMIGFILGGQVRMVWFPEFEADFMSAQVELREGAPESLINSVVTQMDAKLREVNDELKEERGLSVDIIDHVYAFTQGGNSANFQVQLKDRDIRGDITPKEIEDRWRAKVGDIAGTRGLEFRSMNRMGGGKPVAFRMQASDFDQLEGAAEELSDHLKSFQGLYEVESSATAGPEEIKLAIKPEAQALGITLADLAGQVRQAFYGAEAQRIQRGDSEVRVMVRYPRAERKSIGNLENMWIRTPDGREVPFHAVADYEIERGYNRIRRVDGQRTVSVTASADLASVEPMRLMGQVQRDFIPDLQERYPNVSFGREGAARDAVSEMIDMVTRLSAGLLLMYALMAIPLKSYVQPLFIMVAIPFGFIGALIGHMITDIAFSSISFIGIIALAGVVVNDSLILVDFINKRVEAGASIVEAALQSGAARFRAILLTSLTTFFGLVPMVLETSMSAQIVIPAAVSLAFGIVFSTAITLILVPTFYSFFPAMARVRQLRRGVAPPAPAPTAAGGAG